MNQKNETFEVPVIKSKDPELEGVANIGEGFAAMLPGLQKQAETAQSFFEETREKVSKLEPEKCIEHPSIPLEVDWPKTFGHSWKNGKLEVYYLNQCAECEREYGNVIVNDRWLRMGIPKKVIHATLENFVLEDKDPKLAEDRRKALAKVRRQSCVNRSGFILMVGKVGTGKSHLGAAVIKGYGSGEFITQYDLVAALRQTYEKGGQEELIEKFREAKVFVLDEISTEVKGSDIAPLLYRILSYRYDRGLLTILTSNETIETIRDVLGIRLADRIRENFVLVNFTWESARKAA